MMPGHKLEIFFGSGNAYTYAECSCKRYREKIPQGQALELTEYHHFLHKLDILNGVDRVVERVPVTTIQTKGDLL